MDFNLRSRDQRSFGSGIGLGRWDWVNTLVGFLLNKEFWKPRPSRWCLGLNEMDTEGEAVALFRHIICLKNVDLVVGLEVKQDGPRRRRLVATFPSCAGGQTCLYHLRLSFCSLGREEEVCRREAVVAVQMRVDDRRERDFVEAGPSLGHNEVSLAWL